MKKLIATFGVTAMLLGGTVAVATTAQAAPICKITTTEAKLFCGSLSNGSSYQTAIPKNFNGTFFFWNHGIRISYPYPGYTPPTGVEELTPFSATTGKDVTHQMLAAGFGLAAYDCQDNGLHGWNTASCVNQLKELITTVKKSRKDIKRTVVYGSSMAGAILTPFIEKNPGLADAVGIMAGVTPTIGNELTSACDMLYVYAVFFDPTIKGCTVMGTKGLDGHMAVLGDFAKVGALLKGWSADLGGKPLAYPAAITPYGIPQRSALLLAGLIAGLPTKSAHMDGISTSALIPEQSINATVAILENTQELLATGYFGGQSISEKIGAGFYDNTKTDFSALLAEEDSGRFNLGLSGDDAITAMLGVLKASPRITGVPSAMAALASLDKSAFNTTKPVVLLTNEADRLVLAGNTQLYMDKAKAASVKAKKKLNALALYALTPEIYTQFDATSGAPLLTAAPSPSGVGHQSFTTNQTMAWVKILAKSASTGKLPSETYVNSYLALDPNFNTDPYYQPRGLKYQN